ncbi:hypothetical protein E5K00_21595 [Hymenobacter aquaticus]|uniref:Glycosyltransferase RgtA/B/C/D-like domain-containing protein n=1 Tax=Hymenobacter aquaticus TaxID=1867101 RepID=A0A4Z0PVZ0_9BACT|nr:hypothetical protein [Hymenobacter aquaticus]TGE20592.1 hypothetical protein E5K00_21595 [Hymenobacter aquaticus]
MLLSDPASLQPAAQRLPAFLRKRASLIVLAVLLHVVLGVAAYAVLYTFGIIPHLPSDQNLLTWDAGLFYRLSQTGYDDPTNGINAFFPLLPLVWHFAGFSATTMSIVNACCAWLGTGLLAWGFRLSFRQTLVVLSTPMLFFTLVPYAEAFFFLWSALMLVGMHRQRQWLVVVGLLGACLSRSAATLFVPAYVFAELLWWGQPSGRVSVVRLVTGLLAIMAAVGSVMFAQYQSHGDALAFYNVHELWQHKIRLPEQVLYSSAGINVLWLDALGVLVALLGLVACAVLGLRWLRHSRARQQELGGLPSRAVLFSLGYCVGAGFFIVFYQGGDLVGLARYILASPFFVVLLAWIWSLPTRSQRWLLAIVLGGGLLVVLAMGGIWRFSSFYPGQAAVYFALFLLYALVHLAVSSNAVRWYREAATGLYALNLLVMVYLFVLFTQGIWVN